MFQSLQTEVRTSVSDSTAMLWDAATGASEPQEMTASKAVANTSLEHQCKHVNVCNY